MTDSDSTVDIGSLSEGPPIRLTVLLTERNWDIPTFIRHYERAASQLDRAARMSMHAGSAPSQPTVYRWLREGVKRPRPVTCAVLEAMFPGHIGKELFQSGDADRATVEILGAGDELSPFAGQVGADVESWEEDDMRRRALLGAAGGAILGGALAAAETVRRQVDAMLPPLPPTDHDVLEWEALAVDYARMVPCTPPAVVFPDLVNDLDAVRRHAELARDRQRPRLMGIVAELSGLTAVCLVNAGNWREANRYFRTAQHAARLSEDLAIYCRIGGKRAIYSLYEPDVQSAAWQHAERVLSVAEDIEPTAGVASARAARAQFLALQGQRSEARSALRDLEATFERLAESVRSDVSTEWGWSERRLLHVRSFVHSYTGDVARATPAQEAALALYPSSPTALGAAQVRLHQATCMIASGDPSGGARHAVTVYESVDPGLRKGQIRTSANFVLNSLPERARLLPAVREARELVAAGAAS